MLPSMLSITLRDTQQASASQLQDKYGLGDGIPQEQHLDITPTQPGA